MGENRIMVNRGPSTEEIRREGGCNLHFIGEVGGLSGEGITGLMDKHQILGKILDKILGKTRGKTRGKIRGVKIVTT